MSSDQSTVKEFPIQTQPRTERGIGWVYWWFIGSIFFLGLWLMFGIRYCFEATPAWSPDGKQIALTCYSDQDYGTADIYVANVDGTGRWRNLTNNRPQQSDSYPAWSPNGKQIAFATDDYFALVNVDGGGFMNLTSDLPVRSGSPIWSPNGQQIAFTASLSSSNDWTPALIYVMNADGSGAKNLVSNVGYVGAPTWSPNGQQIAFLSEPTDGGAEIKLVDVNGDNMSKLAEDLSDEARGLTWSPNGQFLAFGDLDGVELISADGNSRKRIRTVNRNDLENMGMFPHAFPVWSPDSQQIAVVYGGNRRAEIWIVNANGSDMKQFAQWPGEIMNVVWSPDGQRIVIESRNDCSSEVCAGRAGIFIMNTDGTQLRILRNPFPLFPVFLFLLPQFILVFGLRSPYLFVRRHTQQAALLLGLNVVFAVGSGVTLYYMRDSLGLGLLMAGLNLLQIIMLPVSTFWGLSQVKRGDCWLMRRKGEGNELPRPWALAEQTSTSVNT